ncbi:fimbria/pilus outer membrane usher protein [Klebsiella oxytoca]|uniref:fimbria/pilus outer membrane usher protein n=1 Tax=Klebsiella oxytoca TaxID=571 RepID=UPI0007DACA27|nr:fimbria/pilus outer membrane usher protein [Klebsiella oxytoca]ELG4819298.1 fimbrial biogenesis outer membrane usher protein [Klebsiella oxytoca]ELK5560217.1 fimbrial biogenesis outer membrane usher protein [Klebsiella oxytoca]ELK5572893.1 fimbrial biogenesis outer membrane usher protein [Klebsiella oxytoca]ELM1664859.1 fimbrial biogenesis outer membrane usher protein [Klebsiella oxytoca]MCY3430805.1 fimbrial biogenesis outer membrane usher protein [Klebsiella oxytoca]
MKYKKILRRGLLVKSIWAALYISSSSAEDFNNSLLMGNSANMDWNNKAVIMTPGEYVFDVYINDDWKGKYTFIVENDNKGTLKIKTSDVRMLDIRDLEPVLALEKEAYINVDKILHGGSRSLKPGEMRVNLEVPQAYVNRTERNWISPEKWDSGINGAFTNYNLSYYNFRGKTAGYTDSENVYLSLNSGLNFGGWHLIDNSSYSRSSSGESGKWRNSTRYLERPFAAINAIVRVGDAYTSSEYFDSVRFRGLTVNKSQLMLPDSQRVYMPVVSGVAISSAVVRVLQDGNVIYQITVPPGPFAIRDLMPTGSRNELRVEVKNNDGQVEIFTVPFSSMPEMLRPGTSDYRFNVGEVNMRGTSDSSKFLQYSYTYGVNNYMSIFAGLMLSNDYKSWLAGSTVSLPYIGSFSGNVEQARYQLPDAENQSGEKYSVSWSKYFQTKTNVTLASYYYRTQDYASFSDYIATRENLDRLGYINTTRNSKQAFSASVSQTLPQKFGKLTLTGFWRNYWNNQRSNRQYNLTYSNNYQNITYSLSLRRTEYTQSYYDSDYDGDEVSNLRKKKNADESLYFSLTIPMSIFETHATVSSRTTVEKGKYTNSDVSLSGEAKDINYSMVLTNDNDAKSRSADLYASWDTSYSSLSTGLTEATDYRQMSLGASGNILAWSSGILASGTTGRNFVIIDAPGLSNAVVNGNTAVRTNTKGQALSTSAVAYRQNYYRLDPDGNQDSSVDLLGNIEYIAPYEGSITYLKYKTDTRKTFTLNVTRPGNEALPFGAAVMDEQGSLLGYVSQGSQVYLKADTLPKVLKVNISSKKQKQYCSVVAPTENGLNTCR